MINCPPRQDRNPHTGSCRRQPAKSFPGETEATSHQPDCLRRCSANRRCTAPGNESDRRRRSEPAKAPVMREMNRWAKTKRIPCSETRHRPDTGGSPMRRPGCLAPQRVDWQRAGTGSLRASDAPSQDARLAVDQANLASRHPNWRHQRPTRQTSQGTEHEPPE